MKMTKKKWREELRMAGLSEKGIERALLLVEIFQEEGDRLIAEGEAEAKTLRGRRQVPWDVAEFLKRVVDAVILRKEVVRRFNGMTE